MDPAQLHLLVNHLPMLGAFLAIPLLALAIWRRREPWVLGAAALVLLFGAAGAIVAENSGKQAEQAIEQLAGVSEDLVHEHADRAQQATPLAVTTALAGLGVLGMSLRRGDVHPLAAGMVLIMAVVTTGAMVWVGQSGEVIRHDEVRNGALATSKDPGPGD